VQKEHPFLIPFGISTVLNFSNKRFIETNEHPTMSADAEKANYKIPTFFEKFLELNAVMWRTNAGLMQSHTWDSRPQDWPWLRRGINFWCLLLLMGD
jgi:dolichyl-phosphate-mannose--protein O-mannosyl transferase